MKLFLKTVFALGLLLLLVGGALGEDPYVYCEAPLPRAHAFPVAGYRVAHVSAVVRHGDRTPVNLMVRGEDAYTWACANAEHVAETGVGAGALGAVLAVGNPAASALAPALWRGTCAVGQLTERGLAQHAALGAAVRAVYGTHFGLLPDVLADARDVYLRSTDLARTRQSALAHVAGVWDAAHRTAATRTLPLVVYPATVETLVEAPDACPRVRKLMAAQHSTPAWQQHAQRVRKVLAKMNAITGRAFDGVFKHSDILHPRLCHNLSLPCRDGVCATAADVQAVHDGANFEMTYQYATDDIARLGIGTFVRELRDRIVGAKDTGSPVYALYGAHDFTLALLFQALHLGIDRWPPYASHMLFELWTAPAPAPPLVRVLYNGDIMRVPGCTAAGGTACSLDELDTIIEQRLTIKDYWNECF